MIQLLFLYVSSETGRGPASTTDTGWESQLGRKLIIQVCMHGSNIFLACNLHTYHIPTREKKYLAQGALTLYKHEHMFKCHLMLQFYTKIFISQQNSVTAIFGCSGSFYGFN